MDNGATTLQKPPAVALATAGAVGGLGSAGRGAYGPALEAGRRLHAARAAVAKLAGAMGPLDVAFTSGCTESMNLLLGSLLGPEDATITTVLDHNAVLRPLWRSGCRVDVLDCDDEGRLRLEALPGLLRPETRLVVCAHGGNLLGNIADISAIGAFCRRHGLLFIVDAAQTMGSRPVSAAEAQFTCFSGHKALFGPQGTGGAVAGPDAPARLYKTGGTGADSFARHQPLRMPDMLEAGTPNLPGLAGLEAGADFVLSTTLAAIEEKETALTAQFLEGIRAIPGLILYGPARAGGRLPTVALNLADADSAEVSLRLWEDHAIATRPGSHCAPLAHRRFGTEKRGMVRFSFSWFNTAEEVDAAVAALAGLAGTLG